MEEATNPSIKAAATGQGTAQSRSTRRSHRGKILGFFILATAVGGSIVWLRAGRSHPPGLEPIALPAADPPPDPRLTYNGPYRNVRPDVKYVGDAACAKCHAEISRKYHSHPMARSLLAVAEETEQSKYEQHRDKLFFALSGQFDVRRAGERVWHRRRHLDEAGQTIYEQEVEIRYVIGSGTRGCSYLIDHDGYLFQSLVSWYRQKDGWDASPGAAMMTSVGRHVDEACLFCHANRTHFIRSSINHFDQPIFDGLAIGCERCHGPGGLHVARQRQLGLGEAFDDTIVNPAHLPHPLREAVCQQCHLQSEARVVRRGRSLDDFRPGLPLESVLSAIVPAEETAGNRQAVNHVQQMYASRCFAGRRGDERLGCISCHDPHERPADDQRVAFYRRRCLNCHATHGCTAPEAERLRQSDDCTCCHMPHYADSDVAHAAATDHRILRRPNEPLAPRNLQHAGLKNELPVLRFPAHADDSADLEVSRDLGIGIVMLGASGKIDTGLHAARISALLQAAVYRDPSDVAAWIALAQAQIAQSRLDVALSCYERVLALDPDREDALIGAAALSQSLHRPAEAMGYWRRAVQLNPWMPLYRANLIPLLIDAGKWDEIQTHAAAWLRLDPESVAPRQLHITLLQKAGDQAGARAEFARIEALRPPNLEALRSWFRDQTR
jgi:hypothetical protein